VNEATVRRTLQLAIQKHLPDATALRYEDRYTKGIPDLSISYNNQTSFWEIKYADPYFATSKVQHYLCEQLDTKGFSCRYVIFQRGIARPKNPRPRQIRIVKPRDISHWQHLGFVISTGRFDYQALVAHILAVHLG
jgi:hypothetical protein